jgi:hypothetical protein
VEEAKSVRRGTILLVEAYVGIFYRKRVLSIDGNNNNDDGKQEKHKLRRRSEQYAEIKAHKGKHSTKM